MKTADIVRWGAAAFMLLFAAYAIWMVYFNYGHVYI